MNMFHTKSAHFPELLVAFQQLHDDEAKLKFLMDPINIPGFEMLYELYGQPLVHHLYYLTRTYNFYHYRRKQILLNQWKN